MPGGTSVDGRLAPGLEDRAEQSEIAFPLLRRHHPGGIGNQTLGRRETFTVNRSTLLNEMREFEEIDLPGGRPLMFERIIFLAHPGHLRRQRQQTRARFLVDGLDPGKLFVGKLQLGLHPLELAVEPISPAWLQGREPAEMRQKARGQTEKDDEKGAFHGWLEATLIADLPMSGSINRR